MARKLRDFRSEADRRFFEGDFLGALKVYRTLLDLSPTELEVRLRIADSLLALGEVDRATKVYGTVARSSTHGGMPLRAIVACKILIELNPSLAPAIDGLARLYARGSARLGKGARPSPADPDMEIPEGVSMERDVPPALAMEEAARAAADLESVAPYPETLPPIPLLSELEADAFCRVVRDCRLVRLRAGELAIREGEPGTSYYMLARGRVRVFRQGSLGQTSELARMAEGSIFGEMALVSDSLRTASVQAETDVDLLELGKEALTDASRDFAPIAEALDRFTRERLLGNLLASSPMFRPFDRKQKTDLMRRFTAHDMSPGTVIIREGAEGRGLFLLLSGQVDVSKMDAGKKILLATLQAGEVFGEISLVTQTVTTATVTASRQGTVLFLAREYFQRLMDAIPTVRAYFEGLTEQRLLDTEEALSSTKEGAEIELGEDDIVLV